MRAVVVYTAWRAGIFAAVWGVGYLAGLRSWVLLMVAAVVAALVSLVGLKRQRSALSAALVSGMSTLHQRLDRAAAKEDAAD